MDTAERRRVLALPLVILIGVAISWACSQDGAVVGGFSLFALCGVLAFGINWLVFIHAWRTRSERLFDLTGGLTYISVILLALVFTTHVDLRALILGAMVIVWAGRLASFLFVRIHRAGSDGRFDEMKQSFRRFLMAWTLQGLWVLLTLACALAAITTSTPVELGGYALAGSLVWLFGFSIEVVADLQKSRFRRDPLNRDRFIKRGLWSWSRHPNYFGEITLWVGVAIVSLPVLQGWQHVALISPVFVFVLLTRISGIPLMASRAQEKWGYDPEYQAYRGRTSRLFPLPPRRLQAP